MVDFSIVNPTFHYRKGTQTFQNYSTYSHEILAICSFWPPDRNAMRGDPKIRIWIREIRIFRKFFFAYFSFYGLLGASELTPGGAQTP